MNGIVGGVADRFACNRKENRTEWLLNGPIIRGNDEGAKSGLHGVVMSTRPVQDEDDFRGSEQRGRRVSWRISEDEKFPRRLPRATWA